MEGWVTLLLDGDGLGHVAFRGTVVDQPGIGNRLDFSLELDQSQLPSLICELDHILATYPVIGTP
jgi:hypothetical protein